uniref:phosphoribosylamine--glycine ligase n=1 Tax=uncultured Bilophila sp. TaxID=529385 RepID=UPI00260064A6|nr:phosphoribosylamine--glycine ligase [uncultured Bilophila sp.]
MRVLIIGSGGREHALSWKIAKGGKAERIYCAPGNGGTAQEGENIPLKDSDVAGLVAFAKENAIDFVIPGPELPLTLGVVDAMRQEGIRCFGPSKWCAQLEGSKAFAKDIMQKAGVPTAACGVFTELEAARAFVEEKGAPIVIKADGLAAGKGVIVAQTKEEALDALDRIMGGVFGEAGSRVVIEEFLVGEEVSLLAFCDGTTALPLPSAQDHKAVFDGDTGPNTGGMGAYSPAPILPDADLEKMADIAIRPILKEMARQGHPFTGILYAGLMMTEDGPKVLEYNVRFGDPECQPLLMRLESDLLDVMGACIDGRLADVKLALRPESALGVVIAAEGYPGGYPKGMEIKGIDVVDALPDTKVFQAGTKREGSRTLSSGGRVLCVTALGNGLVEAQKRAYEAVAKIDMDKSQHRSDIGAKGLRRL